MSSLPPQESYSNLSSWRLARYQGYIATWNTRLTAVQAQMTQLLANPVESYGFNAGQGNAQATRRKLASLAEEEDRLVGLIDKYTRILYGGGLVTHMMRRK